MTQPIALRITVCSAFALLLSGCLTRPADLEAGLDDAADGETDNGTDGNDEAHTDEGGSDQLIECLMGTTVDTVGTEQSVKDPECGEVTCAEGWGHDGDQLEIAMTIHVEPPVADQPYQARTLGLLENGHVVVAIAIEGSIDLQFFDPAAQVGYGGYTVDDIGSRIYGIEIESEILYVTHGDEDGSIELRAVNIASQQPLWSQTFVGHWATDVARSGGKLAFVLAPDPEEPAIVELVVLDLDGNALWNQPTVENANTVAISPSGDRIAVSGEFTRVYSADDGELLDEFVHGSLVVVWPQGSTFLDEDHLAIVGTGLESNVLTGWLSADSLAGDITWEHVYDRASSWCPEANEEEFAETGELLNAVTRLADGSLVAVGVESFGSDGVFGSHPWVARFSASGEFLASDRGLWDGYAIDTVAAPDGSVFVLIGNGVMTFCDGPCEVSEGFAVRKYVP